MLNSIFRNLFTGLLCFCIFVGEIFTNQYSHVNKIRS